MVAEVQERPESWVTVHLEMRGILGGGCSEHETVTWQLQHRALAQLWVQQGAHPQHLNRFKNNPDAQVPLHMRVRISGAGARNLHFPRAPPVGLMYLGIPCSRTVFSQTCSMT